MAESVKKRHYSGTKMSDYLGPGKTLDRSELPTLRAALRQGLKFKEEKILQETTSHPERSYVYSTEELLSDIVKSVEDQYLRAIQGFQPPVVITDRALFLKLRLSWETAMKI